MFKLVATTVVLSCCQPALGQLTARFSADKTIGDTVKKEIPLDRKGRPTLDYRLDNQKASQLGLDNLEAGYDSIQIRVWFDYSLARRKHLVIVSKKAGIWNCRLFVMEINWISGKDSDIVIDKSVRDIDPEMGWDNFIRQLSRLKITDLPNGPSGGMDGTSYNVEIATKSNYRFYTYWSPESSAKVSEGSKYMVKIIALLENTCHFRRMQE